MKDRAGIGYLAVLVLLMQTAVFHGQTIAAEPVWQRIATDAVDEAYFLPDPHKRTLRAYLIFRHGEFHNNGVEGMAHYVEHLAWLNTFKVSDASRHSNAWTSLYSTGYWLEFDKSNYESRLDSLFSVVNEWTLDESFMLEERGVIEQEYNTGYLENPYLAFAIEKRQALFAHTGHARSVIGTPEAIRQFDLSDARRLHQRSHRLANATLLITGHSSPEQIARWLKNLQLPAIERDDAKSQSAVIDLPVASDDQRINSSVIPASTLYVEKLVGHTDCGTAAQCDLALQIIESVIDSSLPGGIANPLRYDNFIARNFSFDLYRLDDVHVIMSFIAQPDLGVSLDELHDAFFDAWSATADGGIPRESVERIRRRIITDMGNSLNDPEYTLSLALDLLRSGSTLYSQVQQQAALQSVGYEQVMLLLERLHSDNGRLVVRRVAKTE